MSPRILSSQSSALPNPHDSSSCITITTITASSNAFRVRHVFRSVFIRFQPSPFHTLRPLRSQKSLLIITKMTIVFMSPFLVSDSYLDSSAGLLYLALFHIMLLTESNVCPLKTLALPNYQDSSSCITITNSCFSRSSCILFCDLPSSAVSFSLTSTSPRIIMSMKIVVFMSPFLLSDFDLDSSAGSLYLALFYNMFLMTTSNFCPLKTSKSAMAVDSFSNLGR